MYEISCFLHRIPPHLPICDMSDICCVPYENVKIIAVLRPMFTATRRVTVTSKIRDWEVNLRIKLHISYIDQLVVPAIFNYLIRAKNVDSILLNLPLLCVAARPSVDARLRQLGAWKILLRKTSQVSMAEECWSRNLRKLNVITGHTSRIVQQTVDVSSAPGCGVFPALPSG